MKKNVPCPACKGNGYITVMIGKRGDYCGVMNETCQQCNGTGVEMVDMTNADRIRAMSDEELAYFMVDRNVNESTLRLMNKDHGLTAVQIEAIRHRVYCDYLQWLKQHAEEDKDEQA